MRVAQYDTKGLIPQIIYIDLVEVDEVTARQRLLTGVTRGRAKPETRPAFPYTPGVSSKPQFPGRAPPRGPADPFTTYLKEFLGTNRSPSWDKELCADRRIRNSKLNYAPVSRSSPPVMSGSRETIAAGLPSRIDGLPRFVGRLLRWRTHVFWGKVRVFTILGDPGAGKSSLVVQAVQYLAARARQDARIPIPVYVNLANFRQIYPPNRRGIAQLVQDAIECACPRYIPEVDGRVPRDGPLGQVARGVLSPDSTRPACFVFDSMDEMPTSGQEYNDRVSAIADFIDGHSGSNIFIVTCRYADFIKLADYSQDLLIQRLDLLPWTEPLVRNYLAIAAGLGPSGRQTLMGLVRQAHGYGDGRRRAEAFYEPLIVALLCQNQDGREAGCLPELWDTFVARKLGAVIPDTGPSVQEAFSSLARLAYRQLWQDDYEAPPRVVDAGCRAGLLLRTIGGIAFEIRPLMSHLAPRSCSAGCGVTGACRRMS